MEEHQAARNDLASLLASTDIAVLFLDPQFRIRRYTIAIRNLMDIISTDVGRPLSDLAKKFEDPNLIADATAVLEKLAPIEREIVGGNDRVYMRRVLPYRGQPHRRRGDYFCRRDRAQTRRGEAARQYGRINALQPRHREPGNAHD